MEVLTSSFPPALQSSAPLHLHETWRPSSLPPSRELAATWRPSAGPPREMELEAAPTDARATPLQRLQVPVEFTVGRGPRYSGACHNLGLGGVSIWTAERAPFGCRVVVYIELEGLAGVTAINGTVRWSKPGVMGVQWDSLGARVTHAILRMIARGRRR